MTRVLITGGTGFFGKSILDYFSRKGGDCEFTVLSRHPFSAVDFSCGATSLVGDVRGFDIGSRKFDWVIHAATPARADVPDEEMRSIIVDGTANALRQAKRCGARKFMMVSSGGVYGRGFSRPVSEEDVCRPCTAYGKAKLEAERMAVNSGLHVLLPRCFAFVGKYLPQDAHFAIGNFIRDVRAGRDLTITGDGSPMRSYLAADDLVEWLWAIMSRGENGRAYNVGSDAAVSIRDLAVLVRDALGGSGRVDVLGKTVVGAADYYVPDISRARLELGLNPRIPLRTAIRNSVSP